MTFRLIEAEKAEHPVSLLCTVLGVTRAGYYAWRRRGPSRRELRDRELRRLIRHIFDGSLETYGVPRIKAELLDDYGISVSAKRIARLMRELGIQGVSRRRKRRFKTTIPAKEAPRAPDLVGRSFRSDSPDLLWVADITYVPTWQGFLFLACVIDAWSRKVVGWSMRHDLRAELVVDALGMALQKRRPAPGLIHHSDRGSQYTSLAFGRQMQDAGVLPSMGHRGDAYDNAVAESFFATLETELLERTTFRTRNEARLELFRWIEGFYNARRRHSTLGQLSPDRFEEIMIKEKKDELVDVPTHVVNA
jgi:putative transposase